MRPSSWVWIMDRGRELDAPKAMYDEAIARAAFGKGRLFACPIGCESPTCTLRCREIRENTVPPAQSMKDSTLDDLTSALCEAPTSQKHWNAKAEFSRRQFEDQKETSRYQIMAAEAEVKAANAATLAADAAVKATQAAERNARYMLASVVVAALAAVASAVSALATVHPALFK